MGVPPNKRDSFAFQRALNQVGEKAFAFEGHSFQQARKPLPSKGR
jgi:hypothetical protein